MPALSAILDIVVRGKNNFCCLCFNINHICLHDEISIQITETECTVTVTDVLQSIFGKELQEYLCLFENICEDCLKSTVSIYTFIQTRHYNTMLLMQCLDGLSNSFDYSTNEIGDNKSLFLSLNTNNFTSKHIYDTKKLDSIKEAFKRLKILNKPKTKKVFAKKRDLPLRKSDRVNIKTSDMLLNPNNPVLHKCKMCSKVYFSLGSLRAHFLRVHVPKDYKCPKCANVFGSPNLLTHHMSIKHSETICSENVKVFKKKATLKRHKLVHHVKLVCHNCGRTYKNKTTYKKHLELNICKKECRANPANAQFTCDYCGKKYTQKMSLRVHIQYEHGNYKAHICEWCGKKFWAQSRLKAHIVKHTQEKKFSCSICQGKFVTKESLLYHTRLHTGEKPYKCSECSCTFISASRRSYHTKAYHLLATEECDICHSKFTSRVYLDKHKKTHKQSHDGEIQESKTQKHDIKDDPKNNETHRAQRERKKILEKPVLKNFALVNIEIPGLMDEQEVNNQIMYQEHSTPSCNVYITSDISEEFIGEMTDM